MSDTRMNKSEREAFVAAPRIGVFSIPRADGPPLSAPVWYDYTPGEYREQDGGRIWLLTGPLSAKGKLLALDKPVTMVAQTETAPYSYVSVECTVAEMQQASDEDSRSMAYRYLGEKQGEAYVQSTAGNVSIRVDLRPQRWLTVDYAKMAS